MTRMLHVTVLLVTVSHLATLIRSDGLYFSNASHILFSSDMTSAHPVYHQDGGRIVGMAHSFADQYLFWSDIEFGTRGIYRAQVDLSDGSLSNVRRIVRTNVNEVNGLSVDWVSRRLYWTDGDKRTIEASDYDGSNRFVLALTNLARPRGIVVDPRNMYLYWNDQMTKTIERSRPDGSNRVTLTDDVEWPNQMTHKEGILRWVDASRYTLCSMDVTGASPTCTDLFESSEDHHIVFGLAQVDEVSYVSVWSTGSILKVDNGNVETALAGLGTDSMFSLVYFSAQESSTHRCSNAGVCDGLCLPTSDSAYRCACPTMSGTVLTGTTCSDASTILLYASAEEGYVGFHDRAQHNPDRDLHIVGYSTRPVAVTYDSVNRMVYWSDASEHVVYRSSLGGDGQNVFLSYNHSLGNVDGLVVDVLSQRLYYTNWGSMEVAEATYSWHRIESVSLTSPNDDRFIVVNNVDKPRGLDIKDNYLYYTDWGSNGRVVRVKLDGTDPEIIGAGLDNPNGLTFWGDTLLVLDSHYRTRTASSIYPARNGSMYVFMETSQGWTRTDIDLPYMVPFGIAALGNSLVIGDWEENALFTATLIPSSPVEVAKFEKLLDVESPMGLEFVFGSGSTPEPVCLDTSCSDGSVCLVGDSNDAVCSCNSYDARVRIDNSCILPSRFLLIADMTSIKLVSLEPSDRSVYVIVQSGGYFTNFAGLTYNPTSKDVYFGDVNRRSIYQYNLDTMSMRLFYSNDNSVEAMAIRNNRLYWTDSVRGDIQSLSLNGAKSSHSVIASGLDEPRALRIVGNNIYWSEVGQLPAVKTQGMTSGSRRTLVSADLQWPNGLFILPGNVDKPLFIGDGKTRRIQRCNIDGSDCEIISEVTNQADHIYDMVVRGDVMLVSDWLSGAIHVAAFKKQTFSVLVEDLMRPTQMYLNYDQTNTECPNDHGCSDNCLMLLGIPQCYCDAGSHLMQDKKSCSESTYGWTRAEDDKCSPSCLGNQMCSQDVASSVYSCVCAAGYGGSRCAACSANYYKSVPGPQECEPCPGGGKSDPDATGCRCPGGFWDVLQEMCQDKNGRKEGSCPDSTEGTTSCSLDSDCPGAQKCCQDICADAVDIPECIYKGVVYNVGDVFNPTLCITCTCTSDRTNGDPRYGGAECDEMSCPPLACTNTPVTPVDSCCQQCPTTEDCLEIFNCPSETVTLVTESSPVVTHVYTPSVSNQCGGNPRVRASPPELRFRWDGRDTIQTATITVSAASEQATCQYNVQVVDNQPPTITCPRDQRFMTASGPIVQQAPSPIRFLDNVGVRDETFTSSVDWSRPLTVGTHRVTYTVTDLAGLQASCSFNVNISVQAEVAGCGIPPQVNDGVYECDGDRCELDCDPSYTPVPVEEDVDVITCTGGDWSPSVTNPNLCARITPHQVNSIIEFKLLGCTDGIDLDDIRDQVDGRLRQHIKANLKSKKIQSKVRVAGCPNSKKARPRSRREPETIDGFIRLQAQYDNNDEAEEIRGEMNTIVDSIENDLANGLVQITVNDEVVPATDAVILVVQEPLVGLCGEGQITAQDGCVACTQGTYQDEDKCALCPADTYQDMTSSTECKPCPADTSSPQGSFRAEHCVAEPADPDDSTNVTVIAAIVGAVGAVVIIIIVIVIILICKRRNKQNESASSFSHVNPAYDSTKVYDEIGDDLRSGREEDDGAAGYEKINTTFKNQSHDDYVELN